jgi:hypothetical protein
MEGCWTNNKGGFKNYEMKINKKGDLKINKTNKELNSDIPSLMSIIN